MADRQEITVSDVEQRLRGRHGEDEQRAIARAVEEVRTLGSAVALSRALDVAMLLLDLRLPAATITAGILEASLGTEHTAVAEVLSTIAALHEVLGQPERAVAPRARAEAIVARTRDEGGSVD